MKNKRAIHITIIFLLMLIFYQENNSLQAQSQNDSISQTVVVSKHSPKKASIYSAIVPGLGQVYNKKYWKVPVIYIGFGALIYSATWNNVQYGRFKDAYLAYPDDEFEGVISQEQLLGYINNYRRYRDLSFIGMVALWGLNVIDASVDAHFFDYDISDDLSIRVEPIIRNNYLSSSEFGVKLSLRF